MHRRPLLALLDAHLARYPEDRVRVDHVRQFVRVHADCFERTCQEGHITGSAWIVAAATGQVLLVHHRKLDRWLQPGGHADGDADPFAVALREATEETGLHGLVALPTGSATSPLDIDVHLIPARANEPAHLHHDIRYLFLADRDHPLHVSPESRALRWVDPGELAGLGADPSVLRMAERAITLLRSGDRHKFSARPADTP